jgi:CheY-like chemotaxis protein
MNILMVEDDPEQVALFVPRLEARGHDVTLVTTGTAAIECACAQPFDAVLMDIGLPGPMTGVEAAGRLRVLRPRLAVIFTTASQDGETLERAKLALPAGFLVKPFSIQQLTEAIERVTSRSMPEISNDHDLLVRLDVKLDLVSVQLNEARVLLAAKADRETIEPRLQKIESSVADLGRKVAMIVGGLLVIEVALKFLK